MYFSLGSRILLRCVTILISQSAPSFHQAAAEVLEAYMTAASLGALAFVVVISCVATAKSRERRAADRRRKMAEGAGQVHM